MYDLVIRNGTVIDGSGLPRYRADVGISGNRIEAIGRIHTKGAQEVDASGHIVTPGFIDGHTHMDAQVFWDPIGSCSCWHGVTTAVMGNCGFSLAPGSLAMRDLIIKNLESAEDISRPAMEAAIPWDWTTFRDYMDAVNKVPKALNYAANVGHSALRTHVMGQRAFEQAATPDDMGAMEHELRDALNAGAIGFTTSRSNTHRTPKDGPVASLQATWDEVCRLVNVMGQEGHGVFELARERDATRCADPAVRKVLNDTLLALAVDSGVPITFGTPPGGPGAMDNLRLIDAVAAAGGRMFGQTHTRGITHMLSFKGHLQFDDLPVWDTLRKLPIDEQQRLLHEPELRKRLVDSAKNGVYKTASGQPRKPDFQNMHVVKSAVLPNPSVAELAAMRNIDPVELMIELALASNFNQLFMQFNPATRAKDDEELLTSLRHPRTVMTFTDSGAHVGLIMDTSIHTHLFAYWVRERQAFTLEEAVRMVTLAPAVAWGFTGRGLLRAGCVADINVIDPDKIAPEVPVIVADLPTGAQRLKQKASGIKATVVAGKVAFVDGEHTGALAGKLLRSSAAGVK